ncbi:MAG: hypothetical protein QOD71_456 [Thermoleophilaceae bacterium]|jgi:hypothetical protein|nr:hypothetical protein [Thermoleophilaceae bacterium]
MASADVAGRDHLAQLCFTGVGGSGGAYTPERVSLSLEGVDPVVDHVVYLHEIHHQGLNDSTAWGSALHVFAGLPPSHRSPFLPLLDACRSPHEAYATFAGVNVASARHVGASATLDRYPMYLPLHEAISRLLAPVTGPHRRYLAATAVARVSMQTPILEQMMGRNSLAIGVSDIRAIDTPNGRWRVLLRGGASLIASAASAADAVVHDTHGTDCLDLDDGRDPDAVSADRFDAAWEDWERAAYAVLADALRAAGASPLEFNGHMEPTREVLVRARGIEPNLPLAAARPSTPAPDDRALAAATIERVRLLLAEQWRARFIDADTDELVASIDRASRIADQPNLVISARLPRRLTSSYVWSSADQAVLARMDSPLVAARVIETDEADASVIAHAPTPQPHDLADLVSAWKGRGPIISIVAASCLIDRGWQEEWLKSLRDAGALLFLIDIELDRFVGSWVSREVSLQAGMVHIDDTSASRWALALSAEEDSALWLLVSDEITVRLFLEQLLRTPGLRCDQGTAHLSGWAAILPIALTHLLATESYLDLEGLGNDPRIRAVARSEREHPQV